ncbi:hypothetical protein, partial [Fulvivirga aurantia]|uniref:hypothetical protein n=1 Tax=Fulvivirga aurantia TaxID=2529383 RepID=UPI0016239C55
WDTYLSTHSGFYLLNSEQLSESLKSHLDSASLFENEVKTNKVNTPYDAATYLSAYNQYILPEKYKRAKFKKPDKLGFKFGFQSSYFTSSPQNLNLEEKSQINLLPTLGLRGEFGLLSLNADASYFNSQVIYDRHTISYNSLIISIYLDLRVLNDRYSSFYLSGGYNMWYDVNSEVTSTRTTPTGDTFFETNSLQNKASAYIGGTYIRKLSKNRRIVFTYNYLSTYGEIERIDPLSIAPNLVDFSYHKIGITYMAMFF